MSCNDDCADLGAETGVASLRLRHAAALRVALSRSHQSIHPAESARAALAPKHVLRRPTEPGGGHGSKLDPRAHLVHIAAITATGSAESAVCDAAIAGGRLRAVPSPAAATVTSRVARAGRCASTAIGFLGASGGALTIGSTWRRSNR